MKDAIEIIAHRGFSERAPENTLSAIHAALEAGTDAIEFDLQTASCGTPVLFHDPHLGRTSDGVGPVRRRTFGQLEALDVGGWFSKEFKGERIPRFVDALDAVRGHDLRVYAEVKGYRELEDLDRMVGIVEDAGFVERTIFISLDFGVVDRIAGQNSEVGIGYVVSDTGEVATAIERAAALGGRGLVDFDRRLVLDDPSLVTRARGAGAEVAVWTVDSREEASILHGAGVRRITTNRVEDLLGWKASVPAGG
ncbi:MAG: glycerophosphodiester phosphodiesterase family protein [Longimicrobiales bacterium]|nr:glycerophosphodiester phosphodiesterase family protein [Longimicrobiales bacterium]